MAEPRYISAKTVAEMAEIPESTIWHYRLTGTGGMPPARKVGGHVRWRLDEIVQWLEGATDTTRKDTA